MKIFWLTSNGQLGVNYYYLHKVDRLFIKHFNASTRLFFDRKSSLASGELMLDMDRFICHVETEHGSMDGLSLESFIEIHYGQQARELLYDLCLGSRIVSCLQSDKLEMWQNRHKNKKKAGENENNENN